MDTKKHKLRAMALELRNSLTAEEVREKSSSIVKKILRLEEYKNSSFIMCYLNFGNEVITRELIAYSLEAGKRVAVPLVTSMKCGIGEIMASEISDIEKDLIPGRLGILEPRREILSPVNPKEFDLVIVPGVVFDLEGNRLGYGAGCYDSFLKQTAKDCLKIGIAFESQMVPNVPSYAHDIPVDRIITEKRRIGFNDTRRCRKLAAKG